MTNKFENQSQKRVAQRNEVTTVDQDGVVVQTTTENIFKLYTASEPHYIKQYQQCFYPVNLLKKKTKEILQEILLYVTYNKNTIYLNQPIKVDICNKLGIAYQTMTNALTELKKSQILLFIDTGLYVVNPFYFGKGEWKELKKIRDSIHVSVSIKNNVETYSFDYSELSNQIYDKSKIKKAKPKKFSNNESKGENKKVSRVKEQNDTNLKSPFKNIISKNIVSKVIKKILISPWSFNKK